MNTGEDKIILEMNKGGLGFLFWAFSAFPHEGGVTFYLSEFREVRILAGLGNASPALMISSCIFTAIEPAR